MDEIILCCTKIVDFGKRRKILTHVWQRLLHYAPAYFLSHINVLHIVAILDIGIIFAVWSTTVPRKTDNNLVTHLPVVGTS